MTKNDFYANVAVRLSRAIASGGELLDDAWDNGRKKDIDNFLTALRNLNTAMHVTTGEPEFISSHCIDLLRRSAQEWGKIADTHIDPEIRKTARHVEDMISQAQSFWQDYPECITEKSEAAENEAELVS